MLRKTTSSWELAALDSPVEPFETPQTPPKPPRHASVPVCAQLLLALWQSVLQRKDVAITSDFFDDLDGSDEQALALVERMQLLGFHISAAQFLSLPRSSIYTVLLVAL